MTKEITCDFGHNCTSDCQNTKDCPCENDHYCSVSYHDISECDAADAGMCNKHKEEHTKEMLKARREAEKELFTTVYNWGKNRIVTDELCNTFQDLVAKIRLF